MSAAIAQAKEAAATGASTQKITMSNKTGVRLHMKAVFSGTTDADRRIEALPRRRNRQAEERFASGRTNVDPLHLSFAWPSERLLKLAFLSWAYLALFRELGYRFVFAEAGRLARSALLGGSLASLSPAFFFTYGAFQGVATPLQVGLLMWSIDPPAAPASPVALAVGLGDSVVALPLGEDADRQYGRLRELAEGEGALGVVPLRLLFNLPEVPLAGGFEYQWRGRDGRAQLILGAIDWTTDLASARPPPRSHPPSRAVPERPDWPPLPLPLPLGPAQNRWRESARSYLEARGVTTLASESDEQDAAWIAGVTAADEVAGRHLQDVRNLFHVRVDQRSYQRMPGGMRVVEALNTVAQEANPEARVVAFDARTVDQKHRFASFALRLIDGDRDRIIGPYYSYQALVSALRAALATDRD